MFREEAFYLKLKAATNLALNSTEKKKVERIDNAKTAYNLLIKNYPESKFGEEAVKLTQMLDKELTGSTQTETISK
jgi:outer membrane protein assembly factor BamD